MKIWKIILLILLCFCSICAISEEIDPTRPADFVLSPELLDEAFESTKGSQQLTLTAIFISKDRKIAVINNTLVKEGETINDQEVLAINNNTVSLKKNGTTTELKLLNKSIKHEAL